MINSKKSEYSYTISAGGTANDNFSSDSGSDENILHVVTNVYTIPLQKECTDQSGIDQLDSDISKKMNEIKINLSKPDREAQDARHKSIDTNSYSILAEKATSESFLTKSKFQIKSIVEIYESQDESESHQGSSGMFKSSSKVNQIRTENQIPISSHKGKAHRFILPITLLPMHHTHFNLLDTKPTKFSPAFCSVF
ncbi:hypothetical protein BpHYR1_011617, partial [Brachionus plicatilis]